MPLGMAMRLWIRAAVRRYSVTINLRLEAWLQENKASIHEQIERGGAQFERGEGFNKEESISRLDAKKAAWRVEQRRA
jgi:hypothetical protein